MMAPRSTASLLEKIADLTGKPVGAFNIRKDMRLRRPVSPRSISPSTPVPTASPASTSTSKTGTKGETCHIPVIISQTGHERHGV